MVPDSPFDIPDSPICSPIPTQDVIPPSFSCYSQHEPDLDLFTIPDSPNISPLDRTGGAISRNPQLSPQVLYPLVRILFSSARLILSTSRIHHQVQSKISVLFPLQVQSTISVSC